MYEENRYEYTVRTCPTEDSQELEELLNEMAAMGWELYSLNEAENDEGEYLYMCIFNRKLHGDYDFEEDQIIDAGDFKATMKRLVHKKDDLYKECRFLQQQLREKNQQVRNVKNSLDSSEDIDRESLNREISDRIGELNALKSKFSDLIAPSAMYSRIHQDLITVVVSHELVELIDSEKDGDLIAESVKLRQKLTDKLGYVIPRVHFTISDEMNENEYAIKVRDLKVLQGVVYPGNRRFFLGQSNIDTIPEDAIADIDPINSQQIFWLDESKTTDFWDKGLTPSQAIISHLEYTVMKYVDEIVCYRDILNYVALLEEGNVFLAEDLLNGNVSLSDLRYIFVNLIREKVPVKDVVYIFEKLNDISKEEQPNDKLLEKLRLLLKRQICSSIADTNNTICAITVPKKYKKALFEPAFIDYVSNALQNNPEAVLISEPQHRKALFDLFENVLPGLTVLSDDEIAEEFSVEEV